jgi:uncharacterized protein (DUF1501 family)
MRTRRWFLRTSGLAVGVLGTSRLWLKPAAAQGPTTLLGAGSSSRKVLVAILQRGAADGLNIVAPFSEKRYYQLRPSIAVPVPVQSGTLPGQPGNGSIDLDGKFAFHQALQQLRPLWDARRLAVVHAAGSPDTSRSHFDAQAYMESGTAGKTTEDGWLNRALPRASQNTSPLRGVAVGTTLPRALRGDRGAVALDDLSKFQIGGNSSAILERLYAGAGDPQLKGQAGGMFDAVKRIESLRRQPYTPANGVAYQGEFGRRLQQLARLIKSDVGVEVAFVDLDGWDHHANELGQLSNMLFQFSNGLSAFTRDLGDRMADVVVVTMSEFGRTAAENGNGGTDHGHGGVMMVLGGPVRGGKVYGQWPGLEPESLFEGRDLAVTTDYRDVLAELVRGHLGQNPDQVFPGYKAGAPLGLLQSA